MKFDLVYVVILCCMLFIDVKRIMFLVRSKIFPWFLPLAFVRIFGVLSGLEF